MAIEILAFLGDGMPSLQGFWSYVHEDDSAESGRIVQLAHDVASQYRLLTGEELGLFLDKDSINWGDDWRNAIDDSLESVVFFVAVMTPRYFQSAECRREFQFFARRASQLGISEVVLPLLYVDVPGLHVDDATDEVIGLIKLFNWRDWTELRFEDRQSKDYRQGVAKLASHFVAANNNALLRRGVEYQTSIEISNVSVAEVESSPGLLDAIATVEERMPELTRILESTSGFARQITAAMVDAGEKASAGTKNGMAAQARLLVVQRLARELAEPVEEIWKGGHEYSSTVGEVDRAVRAIIEVLAERRARSEAVGEAEKFLESVRRLATTTGNGLISTQKVIGSIAPLEGLSRDLRPVVKRLRSGLVAMTEGQGVIESWLDLLDKSGL